MKKEFSIGEEIFGTKKFDNICDVNGKKLKGNARNTYKRDIISAINALGVTDLSSPDVAAAIERINRIHGVAPDVSVKSLTVFDGVQDKEIYPQTEDVAIPTPLGARSPIRSILNVPIGPNT